MAYLDRAARFGEWGPRWKVQSGTGAQAPLLGDSAPGLPTSDFVAVLVSVPPTW